MDTTLTNLEPKPVWKYFLDLCNIPRGSKNEKAVAAWVLAEAKRLGLEVKQDACGNVIAFKKGSKGRENEPAMVLQGHLDMVCEKNESTQHDFTKDPIRATRDGDWVKAQGTTLGADNGIGVAAALAVMASTDVSHPPLELLFTIDEETGLTGAFNLEKGLLKGTRMLNLDTEEEGAIYIGCAGGMDTVATRKVARAAAGNGKKALRLKVSGLKGGHSGIDIHTGRGNALKILARALRVALPEGVEVASLSGGSKRNAIPREASAVVMVDAGKEKALRDEMAKLQSDLRSELGKADPELTLTLDSADAPAKVLAAQDARAVVDFLNACMHGTLAWTPDIPGLVQTSTNLAIIETNDDAVVVSMSHRSSIESAKKDVGAQILALCTLAGFDCKQGDGYPGWKPNVDAKLLKDAQQIHTKLFGRAPEVKAVHAGLECGIIGQKYPGMEMISFGPTITGAHSPDEKLKIDTVPTFWRFLTALLEKA